MSCKHCQKNVSDSDRIVCRGYCGAAFHMICVKVDLPLLDQLGLYSKNVFWMCTHCADLFSNGHFRHVVGRYDDENKMLSGTMHSMQDDIAKLTSSVAALTARVEAQPPVTPTWPRQNRPIKRRLQVSQDSPRKTELPKSLRGKKVMSTVPIITTSSVPENMWWIWLASFPPSVSEEDIRTMVKECLSCDDDNPIDVKLLVKKGTDVASLRSVTFKVGIDLKYRDVALDDATWPEGVVFREFVDFGGKQNPIDASVGFSKAPRIQ